MSGAVKQLAWDAYSAAVRHWHRHGEGGEKPRAAFQIGSHIASLPVEANREGTNLPAVPARDGAA